MTGGGVAVKDCMYGGVGIREGQRESQEDPKIELRAL